LGGEKKEKKMGGTWFGQKVIEKKAAGVSCQGVNVSHLMGEGKLEKEWDREKKSVTHGQKKGKFSSGKTHR